MLYCNGTTIDGGPCTCQYTQEDLQEAGIEAFDKCKTENCNHSKGLHIKNADKQPTPEQLWSAFCKRFKHEYSYHSGRRDSGEHSKDVDFDHLGEIFPFENREIPCRQLFNCIYSQSQLKVSYDNLGWDLFKRQVLVPVTEGLSGQGKSRYAREFIIKILEILDSHNDSELESHKEFIKEIETCLNIRIAGDECIKTKGGLESALIEILYQFLKYKFNDITRDEIGASVGPFLTMNRVLEFLKSCGVISIFINVDEADKWNDLGIVLNAFGIALWHKHNVYFTVTGLYNKSISDGLVESGLCKKDILIAPLSMSHCERILAHIGLDGTLESVLFKHWVGLAGGIPRYLVYLLQTLAIEAGISHREYFDKDNVAKLKEFILKLSNKAGISILQKWFAMCGKNKTFVSNEAILAIIDLCVSGVSSNQMLNTLLDEVTRETVASACQKGMICLVEDDKGKAYVHIPPVLLRSYAYNQSSPNILLGRMTSVLSSKEYETILVHVLQSKLNALRLIGTTEVYLSVLLGKSLMHGQQDPLLLVPDVTIKVETAKNQITSRTFQAVKNSATFNIGTAVFADAVLTLETTTGLLWTFFLQLKQSTTSRSRRLEGRASNRSLNDLVNDEIGKVHSSLLVQGTFVYVTDFNQLDEQARNDVVIIDATDHIDVYGKMIGTFFKVLH